MQTKEENEKKSVTLHFNHHCDTNMKKYLPLLLLALMSILGSPVCLAQATTDFSGKLFSVGENASNLETGKWYFLYNASTSRYVVEGEGNTLGVTATSPNKLNAATHLGYLVQLEAAEKEGQYFIKTGLGNYYCNVTSQKNNGTSATTDERYVYAISKFNETEGHWVVQSNPNNANDLKFYLQASATNVAAGMSMGMLNGDRDWFFREVKLTSADELKGRDYVNYVLGQGGLVRLTNRRRSNYSLADNGTNTVGQPNNKKTLQQVWVLEKKGSGYTLRNGETGRFLNDDDNFRSPSNSATSLYIQFSPNNSGESSWINISEDSKFKGNVCLNLNGDSPTTLYKWTCEGDAGSDWTITQVTEYTLEEVQEHLNGNSKYVSELKEDEYYHIVCTLYDRVITESTSENTLNGIAANREKINQIWRLKKKGNEYQIQNALTDRYIVQQNGAFSKTYKTSANTANTSFVIYRTDDQWNNTWLIADTRSVGLHCASTQSYNIVGWYTDADASVWAFEKVDITQEEIDAAKASMNEYNTLLSNISSYQKVLDKLFSDKACTTLRSEIQALSDEELAQNQDFASLNDDMKAMVLKIKNDAWVVNTDASTGYSKSLEKFFRMADYRVYSHYQKMTENGYAGQSNSYGKLSNPTGIVAAAGDIIYIYVERNSSSDCTLQLEACNTEGNPGDHQTGSVMTLKAGLNVIQYSEPKQLYIFYQLNDPKKYLADYPDIKIHIEGGQVTGYWDATRNMTNEDWQLMKKSGFLSISPVINLKTKHLVFAMDSGEVLKAITAAHNQTGDKMEDVEKLMRIWDTIVANEEYYQGLEHLEGRYNNIWNAFSIDYNYMFATTYGTYYNLSTIGTVMNYYAWTHQGEGNEGGALWGPSHEIGHNHQKAINMVGTTESSNNLFSNINLFEQGVSTTRYKSPIENFSCFNNKQPWNARDISVSTRMFFQLYLYFHVMHNDDTFLPRLFKALRQDPINPQGAGWDNSLVSGDNVGGYRSNGREDYLKFAKKVCDVAQADLSEFFEAYGMFIPVENYFVGDYSNYFVTTTQKDIDEAKAYMKKYPKKLGNIMFIDDHIATNQEANANNKFEAVPAADGKKVNCCTYSGSKMGSAGDTGFYQEYTDKYQNDGYYYTQRLVSPYTVTIRGKGAMGYKIYDMDGNLVMLSNTNQFDMSKDLFKAGFVIKAAEANGYDVIVPKGNTHLAVDVYYPGQEGSLTLYTIGGMTPLPTNALAIVRPDQEIETYENVKAMTNVVDADGRASQIAINGNLPFYNPITIQAANVNFYMTLDHEGYNALSVPFETNESDSGLAGSISVVDGNVLYNPFNHVPNVVAGNAIVAYTTNITLNKQDVAITPCNYQEQEGIYALDSDLQSISYVDGKSSPFTYNFGKAYDNIPTVDAIKDVLPNANNGNLEIYDIMGRRHTNMKKGQIYIINRKKIWAK